MGYKAVIVVIFAVMVVASFFVDNVVKAESRLQSKISHLFDLFNPRKKESTERNYNCDMKDRLPQLNISNYQNVIISRFPKLLGMFCPCKEDPVAGLNRKSRRGTPLQMHFGGFSTHQCWRELDMFLMENACESQSEEINLEWAKFLDCDDAGQSLDCKQKFFEAMRIQANASPSPTDCIQYVEAIQHLLPAMQNISHNYNISYISISNVQYMQPEDYHNGSLYIFDIFKADSCSSRKRELTALQYMYERCITGRDEMDCDAILEKATGSDCKLMPKKRQERENSGAINSEGKQEGKLGMYLLNTITMITIIAFWWICGGQWHQKLCRGCLSISTSCKNIIKDWEYENARRNGEFRDLAIHLDPVHQAGAHEDRRPAPLDPIQMEDLGNRPVGGNMRRGNDDNDDGDDNNGQVVINIPVGDEEPVNLQFWPCFKRMCKSLNKMRVIVPFGYTMQLFLSSVAQPIRSFFIRLWRNAFN